MFKTIEYSMKIKGEVKEAESKCNLQYLNISC